MHPLRLILTKKVSIIYMDFFSKDKNVKKTPVLSHFGLLMVIYIGDVFSYKMGKVLLY